MILNVARITGMALLSLILIGCVTEPPPFDPYEFHRQERVVPAETAPRPKPPLPTTHETSHSRRGDSRATTRRALPPTTGTNIGTDGTTRMSLR